MTGPGILRELPNPKMINPTVTSDWTAAKDAGDFWRKYEAKQVDAMQ